MADHDDDRCFDWPKVADVDSLLKVVQANRRSIRLLRLLCGALMVGQLLVVTGILNKIDADQRQRSERFCLLTQQAISNATPDRPVDPLLIAAAESAACRLVIPPGTRLSMRGTR